MKPTAWLLNFGRGPLIVRADLIAASTNKTIAVPCSTFPRRAAAGDRSLLETRHPVLPHIGGAMPAARRRGGDIRRNARRFLAGEPFATAWTGRAGITAGSTKTQGARLLRRGH